MTSLQITIPLSFDLSFLCFRNFWRRSIAVSHRPEAERKVRGMNIELEKTQITEREIRYLTIETEIGHLEGSVR